MKKTIYISLALILFGLIVGFVRQFPVSNPQTIRIGAAYALTGDAAVWGESALNGTKLAIQEINNLGGISGKQLELIVEDIHSTSKDSVSAVSKLQSIDKVDALLVGWLDVYQGAESILKPNTLMISPDAGTEGVNGTILHQNVFSTWYRTQPKSELMIRHMAATGKKKLYIIAQNASYYITAVSFMEKAAAKYGIEIVGKDMLNPDTSMTTILTKISVAKPDAVFVALYDEQENVDFFKKWRSFLGTDIAMYGDEFIQQNYARSDYSLSWFEGFYFYSPRNPEKAFANSYRSVYGKDPIFGASTAYDSVYMIAQAIKDKPADLNSYMRSTTFNTVSYGKVTFDKIGGIDSPEDYFVIKQIQKGRPAEVKF